MSDLGDLFKAAAEAKRKLKLEQEQSQAGQALKHLQERLKKNNDIGDMMETFATGSATKIKEVVVEKIVEVEVEKEKEPEKDSFQQPSPQPTEPNLVSINKKLKFLEQAIGKIAATGPGGGEVNLRWLDDVDRTSIGDGKYLNYNSTTKKFQFSTLSGGDGAPQVQSDWDQTDNTEPSFIKNKPTLFTGSYNDLTDTPTLFTGSYNDLTDTPTIFSGSYADLTDTPTLFTGSYNDLTDTPTLFTGSYNDLTDTPTIFSGSYADLTDTPTIFSGSYADLSDKPTLFTGSYADLTDKPTLFSGAGSSLSGTTLASGITSSSLTSLGTLTSATINYAPGTTAGAGLTISAKDSQGGTGWADFLKATTTVTGATNPHKWFRLSSVGTLEVVNSAYSATIFSLSDAGILNVNDVQVGGKKAVNGPTFSVYRNSTQTIPTDVLTLMSWDVEEYDTAGRMTSTRFTPNVEGYYSLVASVRFDGDIGTGERMISIKKNGNEYRRGMNAQGSASVGTSWFQMEVSCQVYANGSSDYFEVFVQHGAGANRNTTAGQPFTAFQGCMLRGA